MEIRKYQASDIEGLFALMSREGDEWTYNSAEEEEKYMICMQRSIAFVAVEENKIQAYVRCKNDDGFGIYVLDLLVDKNFRGRNIGGKLIEEVRKIYPAGPMYITSDSDGYYKKQGFEIVGTLFEVK